MGQKSERKGWSEKIKANIIDNVQIIKKVQSIYCSDILLTGKVYIHQEKNMQLK